MAKREPIRGVIDKPTTSAALRAQLEAVTSIRDFASRDLGLPDNGSYRSYADVGRPYVVWNVVAAPEFSVDPKQWCYPFVGCVAYRGYFAENKARSYAAGLRAAGLDVFIGGVAAYSTLGHFDDPILNTMVGWNDVELASIIFHELTHQLLYVPNDASFNEALATTVAEAGVRRWLKQQGRDRDLADHQLEQERYLAVIALFNATRTQLREVHDHEGEHDGDEAHGIEREAPPFRCGTTLQSGTGGWLCGRGVRSTRGFVARSARRPLRAAGNLQRADPVRQHLRYTSVS